MDRRGTGAGKASGVQPYTKLNMLWQKYSMALRPMLDASTVYGAEDEEA